MDALIFLAAALIGVAILGAETARRGSKDHVGSLLSACGLVRVGPLEARGSHGGVALDVAWADPAAPVAIVARARFALGAGLVLRVGDDDARTRSLRADDPELARSIVDDAEVADAIDAAARLGSVVITDREVRVGVSRIRRSAQLLDALGATAALASSLAEARWRIAAPGRPSIAGVWARFAAAHSGALDPVARTLTIRDDEATLTISVDLDGAVRGRVVLDRALGVSLALGWHAMDPASVRLDASSPHVLPAIRLALEPVLAHAQAVRGDDASLEIELPLAADDGDALGPALRDVLGLVRALRRSSIDRGPFR